MQCLYLDYAVGRRLQHRLRANVAAFISDYKDLQLPVSTIDPGTGLPAFLPQSVGSARIEGVEIELNRKITDIRAEMKNGRANKPLRRLLLNTTQRLLLDQECQVSARSLLISSGRKIN